MDWTTDDASHARSRGFPLYLTDAFVDGQLRVYYSFKQEHFEKAKAAADNGDPVAQKALALLTIQRLKG